MERDRIGKLNEKQSSGPIIRVFVKSDTSDGVLYRLRYAKRAGNAETPRLQKGTLK